MLGLQELIEGRVVQGWGCGSGVVYKQVGLRYIPHLSSPFPPMSSTSSPSVNISPTIVFGDEPGGTSIPVLPNFELKHGAFCIINPNYWGVENPMVFNSTMNYTEVRVSFLGFP